jgi:hypothetical protein
MSNQKTPNYTITRQWYEGDFENGEAVYFFTETFGLKSLMQGNSEARACFGSFEVRGRYVVHAFYAGDNLNWTEEETYCTGSNDSHMLDDIRYLLEGNVDFVVC